MPDERALGGADITRMTELIRLADRFGLTWGRRPGTVVSTVSPFTSRQASVIMDGDTAGVTVVSLTGDLVTGDRVMVDRVPPSGLYAVGVIDRPASYTQASTTSTGTIIGETVTFTFTGITLIGGYAYRVEGGNRVSSPSANAATFRLRKTNVAGAIASQSPAFPGLVLGVAANGHWTSFIAPAVTMTADFVYTCQGTLTGVVSFASATSPRFVSITPAGPAAAFPQAVSVA